MRIAVVHSFYNSSVPSGENQVVTAQVAALRAAGHEVALVSRSSDDRRKRRTYPVEAALTAITGVGPDPTAELEAFEPDVVHVHNLFPNFGTRWLTRWPGAMVATLHNYRPMCAGGYLFRDGGICTACPDGDRWAGVRHGCYHGSSLATVPLAWEGRGGATAHPVVSRADALVVLSERSRRVYRDAGVEPGRLHIVPNFVADLGPVHDAGSSVGPWLCVARLTPEKGVAELVASWPAGRRLDVVGEGSEAERIRALSRPDVRLLGPVGNKELRERMPDHGGLVMPSRWFEGLPTVYLEALAAGLPVLAVAGSSAADDVENHALGAVVPRDTDARGLAVALDAIQSAGPELRARARDSFTDRFTVDTWLRAVTSLYASAARPPTPQDHRRGLAS